MMQNKYQILTAFLARHWWKVAILVIVAGFFAVPWECDPLGFKKGGLKAPEKVMSDEIPEAQDAR